MLPDATVPVFVGVSLVQPVKHGHCYSAYVVVVLGKIGVVMPRSVHRLKCEVDLAVFRQIPEHYQRSGGPIWTTEGCGCVVVS